MQTQARIQPPEIIETIRRIIEIIYLPQAGYRLICPILQGPRKALAHTIKTAIQLDDEPI